MPLMPPIDRRLVLIAAAACSLLAGCSGNYYDRRDSIALSSGDAIASDQVVQMVDPWPRASRNRNIAFNGQRMQSAMERYRTNKVTKPVSALTSSAGYGAQQQPSTAATPSSKP